MEGLGYIFGFCLIFPFALWIALRYPRFLWRRLENGTFAITVTMLSVMVVFSMLLQILTLRRWGVLGSYDRLGASLDTLNQISFFLGPFACTNLFLLGAKRLELPARTSQIVGGCLCFTVIGFVIAQAIDIDDQMRQDMSSVESND